jgi:hypothetical protein
LDAEHNCRLRIPNPGLVHADGCVAHAGDEIHEIVVFVNLCEPDRIADLAMESQFREMSQGDGRILRGQKKVKVFGGSTYTSMLQQRVGTRDREGNSATLKSH